jgi:hypothetical protein
MAGFLIRCSSCKWVKTTNGSAEELKELYEIKGCNHCTGRKFRCPKCGYPAKMKAINRK